MAEIDDIISRLRGYATGGRGVPTDTDLPNTGRYGGYPGWERLMPRAPGNSPSPSGRLGGTYTPSGNMPAVGGSGVGGPPASLSGMLGNAARGTPWNSVMLGPIADIASRKDQYPSIESIARSHQNEYDRSFIARALKGLRSQPQTSQPPQSSSGGSLMPIPIPPASAAPIQAQPIPNVTGNMPAQLVKDQSRVPAQPPWSGMAQTPNNVPPTPGGVPLPPPRPPQAVQQVPLPTPRPRIPLPTPRPQMPIARPVHPAEQAAQNKSILDTLLSSFDPNAAWRQQYR